MSMNNQRELGRAKNAVLKLFEERLYIPKVYLDVLWEDQRLDVMAIDRDGIGDVHLVLLVETPAYETAEDLAGLLEPAVHRVFRLKAQYKYVALVEHLPRPTPMVAGIPVEVLDIALSPDGVGRVGFLSIVVPLGEEPKARYLVRPERFRANVAALADDYVRQNTADWELRSSPVA